MNTFAGEARTFAGLVWVVGTAVVTFAAAFLGLRLQLDGMGVFWPAAGIGVGAFLIAPVVLKWYVLGAFVLGVTLANLLQDRSLATIAVFVTGNALQALAIGVGLERLLGRPLVLDRLSRVARFLGVILLVVAGVGLVVGPALTLTGHVHGSYLDAWRLWLGGQAVGIMTITPTVLLFPRLRQEMRQGLAAEDMALVAAVATVAVVTIGAMLPSTSIAMLVTVMLIVPLIWWVLLRASPWRAAIALIVISLVTIWLTAEGTGLFAEGLGSAQLFLALVAVALLTLGAWRGEEAPHNPQRPALLDSFTDLKAIVLLVPMVLFAATAWWTWRSVEGESRQRVERTTAALAGQIQRLFEVQDGLLQAVLARVNGLTAKDIAGDPAISQFLEALRASTTPSQKLSLIDPETGRFIALSGVFPAPDIDVSERDYVRRHRDQKVAFAIGDVIRPTPDDVPGFTISRRDPTTGLIAGSRLSLDIFQGLYAGVRQSDADAFLLARGDGTILARLPHEPVVTRSQLSPNALMFRYIRGELTEPVFSTSVIDARPRLGSVHKVSGLPLYVYFGLDASGLRSTWLRQLVPFGLLALLSTIAVHWLTQRMQLVSGEAEAARAQAHVQTQLAEASRRSEELLRESHRVSTHLAAIVTSSMDAIISKTSDGTVTTWNRSAELLFGFTAEEMIGQSIRRIIPLDRLAEEDDILRRISAGETISSYETVRLHRDGRRIEVSLTISPMHDRLGNVVGASKIAHDITRRKQAAKALEESEAYTRRILESSPDCVQVIDPDGRLEFMNANGQSLMGIEDFSHCAGHPWSGLWPAEVHGRIAEVIEAARDGKGSRFEAIGLTRKGEPKWWDVHVTPMHDADGTLQRIISVSRDVTARKATEAQLAASEARFRGIFRNAGTAIAISRLDGAFEDCNPAFVNLIGTEVEDLKGSHFMRFVHAEDREENARQVQRLISGEIDDVEIVNRLISEEGTLWVHKHISLLRDAAGVATHVLALITNITDRKRAEERQNLMMRELAHRGKNLLAVVQSVASRSLSQAQTIQEAREAFTGRLQALARSYGSLTDEAFEGAPLRELVAGELSSFTNRVTAAGPRIMLTAQAAQTFSLVIHELATNAIKHGALSVAEGLVEVRWSVAEEADGSRFRFSWVERNGPAARRPDKRGFGSTLITSVAGAEFGCEPQLEYSPSGFSYRLDAALESVGAPIKSMSVRQRLQDDQLRALYDAWASLPVNGDGLPVFSAFDSSLIEDGGGTIVVEVSDTGEVKLIHSAPSTASPGRRHAGSPALSGGLSDAAAGYRQCARERRPVYEHARFDFGDGRPAIFERLLVPFAASSDRTVVVGRVIEGGEARGSATI